MESRISVPGQTVRLVKQKEKTCYSSYVEVLNVSRKPTQRFSYLSFFRAGCEHATGVVIRENSSLRPVVVF